MKVITDASEFGLPGAVVSIGMFDGVHRGHRRVLNLLRDIGRQRSLPTVLVTFDPHPRAVLRPESRPPLLSSLADRIALLARTGAVDYCLVLGFDRKRGAEPVEDFVEGTLVRQLGIRSLVVGENFACGRGRKGDVGYLRTLGECSGFVVHAAPLRSSSDPQGAAPCSSTETRRLIQIGDVRGAAALLDRPHEITGMIAGPTQARSRALEVVLPEGICTPAAFDYAGEVTKKDAALPWIPAILQVREDRVADRRSVQLVADEDLGLHSGDLMRLRFFSKMDRLDGLRSHSVGGAASACSNDWLRAAC
jgi:riboflavin kinase/FMN adenylyltransferase